MTDQTQDQPESTIQQLRDAAARGTTAQAEADAAKRELALVKAGVDTESPLGKMFHRSYDGELTTEAIKAAWLEIAPNAAPPEAPAEGSAPNADDLDQTRSRRVLSSGGAGDTPVREPDIDPALRGYAEMRERMAKGESREKAAGSVFGSLLQAAAAGDERALVKPWTEEQLGR